jgi:hypothetical protein
MEIITEIWKPVRGYEQYIEVSNFGNMKQLERIASCGINNYRKIPEKLLTVRLTKKNKSGAGSSIVFICIDKKRIALTVGRIVYQEFNNIELGSKMTITHKDGNALNNSLENLKVLTRRDVISNNQNKNGFKGIRKDNNNNNYVASIIFEKRRIVVHISDSKEECHKIYQLATDTINQYDKKKIEILNKSKLKNKIIIAKVKSGI